jgi:hypothetical protein
VAVRILAAFNDVHRRESHVMNKQDMRTGPVLQDAGGVDYGSHVPWRIFVAAAHGPAQSIDHNQGSFLAGQLLETPRPIRPCIQRPVCRKRATMTQKSSLPQPTQTADNQIWRATSASQPE